MKKWYKYLIAGCLAVTMAAGFAGCGSSGDSASADEQVVIYTNADRKRRTPSSMPWTATALKENMSCRPSARPN